MLKRIYIVHEELFIQQLNTDICDLNDTFITLYLPQREGILLKSEHMKVIW